ncbi:MAG: hypothetical protein WAK57_01570, partial [Desulfobacterales bacterium]
MIKAFRGALLPNQDHNRKGAFGIHRPDEPADHQDEIDFAVQVEYLPKRLKAPIRSGVAHRGHALL